MKKLLFIALLMPLGLMAQKDSGTIDFKSSWFTETAKQDTSYLLLATYDTIRPKLMGFILRTHWVKHLNL